MPSFDVLSPAYNGHLLYLISLPACIIILFSKQSRSGRIKLRHNQETAESSKRNQHHPVCRLYWSVNGMTNTIIFHLRRRATALICHGYSLYQCTSICIGRRLTAMITWRLLYEKINTSSLLIIDASSTSGCSRKLLESYSRT